MCVCVCYPIACFLFDLIPREIIVKIWIKAKPVSGLDDSENWKGARVQSEIFSPSWGIFAGTIGKYVT